MARRRRLKTPSRNGGNPFAFLGSRAFRYFLGGVLIIGILFAGARKAANAILQSAYFKIKTVEIDRTLSFMDRRDLKVLDGKSIFAVDVGRLQRNLTVKYPQMAQVTITRKFPDTILVLAKKRAPFARVYTQNKTFLVDDQGVVLWGAPQKDEVYPLIAGIPGPRKVTAGTLLRGENMTLALNIIKAFARNPSLAPYAVKKIDVDDLKEIDFHLTNGLKIIVDKNDIERRMETLALVLGRNQVDTKEVKYIDLRFKDPILGTK